MGSTCMRSCGNEPEGFDEDEWHLRHEEWLAEEYERTLSDDVIEEQNRSLLQCYHEFRRAADTLPTAWRQDRKVEEVSQISSLARDPWKEVPQFSPYRCARIELWHECKDVDLAFWLSDTGNLNGLHRTRAWGLRELLDKDGIGIASHQIDVFVLDPGTDCYFGHLAISMSVRRTSSSAACPVAATSNS